MKLIILAAPGAGKGTQAELLSKHYNIPTISTGAILRKNISDGTELGEIAARFINDGKFVPDDVMIQVVTKRIAEDDCKNGFILDGFPRNITQAEALEKSGIEIDAVLTIEVPDETIVERLGGRLECKNCGTSYHKIYNAPQKEGVCDKCGNELVTRADDKPETIRERLNTYHETTEPLKKFYEEKGLLRVAEGQNEIADTTAEVLKALA
ncbi:MAG: adenylate kinase [Ruminococcaceae bacterium]|nr:adenylate kinase [Oscillospiraceae bacterium]